MSKRITESRLKNYAQTAGLIGVPLGTILIAFMIFTGAVSVGNYTANEKCGGDVLCYLEMHDVCFKEDVFVYPMDGADIINARPSDDINSFKLLRSWGEGFREINLNETCKSTSCGGKRGVTENKYAYAFREGKCYDLRIEVEKSEDSTINWNINPSGSWFPLDYISDADYSYTFANKTIEVTKYHMVNESYKVPVYRNESYEAPCNVTNETGCYTPCINFSNSTWCQELNRTVFDHYDTEWHMVNESYQEQEQVPDNQTNKILGVTIDGDYYKSIFEGGMFFYNDTLSTMKIHPGDRNWLEYPTCRGYEILKNACYERYFK